MKMLAGGRLNMRKPHAVPQVVRARTATKYWPRMAAQNAKKKAAIVAMPAASPSMLSRKLIALTMNRIQNVVMAQVRIGCDQKKVTRTPQQATAPAMQNWAANLGNAPMG
ncbi:MAG: hypothetical protein A3K19_04385 [Lentisphaerae bacterium RIFOXYB12_FULL_65_16]|nr:MAG: hypothetical protein A3K18_34855 [Lentisphaerae bacterium RIFOXYA12_64_32]OGV84559.1 MAG: hypothetical protein A3K19_04385 [Lentisphaerae bacterium RIFOXYB12_FULL_65_16]